jgi:hypothetical protein
LAPPAQDRARVAWYAPVLAIRPAVEQLYFTACRIPDGGIRVLKKLEGLTELQVASCDLGWDFGGQVRELPDLQALFVTGDCLMDRGLEGAFGNKTLHYLLLQDSAVTGECFSALLEMDRPLHLWLAGCHRLGQQAIDHLAQAGLANPEFAVTLIECSITEEDVEKRVAQLVEEREAAP